MGYTKRIIIMFLFGSYLAAGGLGASSLRGSDAPFTGWDTLSEGFTRLGALAQRLIGYG